jgi:hypothetical protein
MEWGRRVLSKEERQILLRLLKKLGKGREDESQRKPTLKPGISEWRFNHGRACQSSLLRILSKQII